MQYILALIPALLVVTYMLGEFRGMSQAAEVISDVHYEITHGNEPIALQHDTRDETAPVW
jgi:hypothetical protein